MPEGETKLPQTNILSTTYFYFYSLTTIAWMILWLCLRAILSLLAGIHNRGGWLRLSSFFLIPVYCATRASCATR